MFECRINECGVNEITVDSVGARRRGQGFAVPYSNRSRRLGVN